MIELWLRTRVASRAMSELAGKILGHADYDVLLTGATRLLMPDGRPLCVYLPGAMKAHTAPDGDGTAYGILSSIRDVTTNRGVASGTKRVHRGDVTSDSGPGSRTESKPIMSSVVGSMDPLGGAFYYCRLTAWTGRNLPKWEALQPFLQAIAAQLKRHVPDRWRAQQDHADATKPEWVVPGTPFTTITVNQSFPTGVHTDKGDLDEGFSTITCLRRGNYTGGQLVFPQYRVAVDLADGDLILMDAHQWHGNVPLVCECGKQLDRPCADCGANRCSVVSYYRTRMKTCGTADEEFERAALRGERRSGLIDAEAAQ